MKKLIIIFLILVLSGLPADGKKINLGGREIISSEEIQAVFPVIKDTEVPRYCYQVVLKNFFIEDGRLATRSTAPNVGNYILCFWYEDEMYKSYNKLIREMSE